MNNKTSLGSAVVALVVALIALVTASTSHVPAPSEPVVGGLDHNAREDFAAGISSNGVIRMDTNGQYFNGGAVESVTSGSLRFTASQICNDTLLTQNIAKPLATASTSATKFPTAAQLITACLPNTGDNKFITLRLGGSAASDIGEVASLTYQTATSNLEVYEASSSNSTIGVGEVAHLRFLNRDGTHVQVYETEAGPR